MNIVEFRRIIPGIWLGSFYQATVNSLTTREVDGERLFVLSLFAILS